MSGMRAVVVAGDGRLELATDVPVPTPGTGQALVRVDACGVCGSDLHLLGSGRLDHGTIMGHEFCGTVVATGDGARAREGERWVCQPVMPCRACAACAAGHTQACIAPARIGVRGAQGGYADYALIDCDLSLPIPESLDSMTAALCEPLSVGLHAVRRSSLRPGDSCAVIGAGCIGLMVLQCALLAGASEVSVVEPSEQRGRAAAAFGAATVLRDPAHAVEHFAASPVDVAFECAGAPGSLQLSADATRRGGEVIGVGVRGEDTIKVSAWFMKELTLRMSLEGTAELPMALRMLAEKRVRPLPMVSRRAGLDDLPAIVAAERAGRAEVKVLVVPAAAAPA